MAFLSAVNHLRDMPHPEFLALLQPIYKVYLNAVTGLQSQGSIIVDILQALPWVTDSDAGLSLLWQRSVMTGNQI
jgi:hypothetical protein